MKITCCSEQISNSKQNIYNYALGGRTIGKIFQIKYKLIYLIVFGSIFLVKSRIFGFQVFLAQKYVI